ncbi:hypothetical protein HHI36_011227 [Cryptolaemus montrouzieri]|uniref:Uncharacterized protein n=1 Tax=Cryptolaemus montrouzieri TaxID=559131 RepID=A0ABD2MLE7_9CUCU
MQKYILKIIYGKPLTYSSNELYAEANILDVRQLFAMQIVISVYRGKINLTVADHPYSTRNKEHIRPKASKTIGKRVYTYLAPRIYDLLPTGAKKSKNLNQFKRQSNFWIRDCGRGKINKIINQFY